MDVVIIIEEIITVADQTRTPIWRLLLLLRFGLEGVLIHRLEGVLVHRLERILIAWLKRVLVGWLE